MPLLYLVLAAFAGFMIPMQAAMNGRLAKAVGGPIWATAWTSLAVALTLTVAGGLLLRTMPRLNDISSVPWWAWLSGLCGAVFLGSTTFVVSRLGAAHMIALVMAGQVLCAMIIDRFGLFGLTAQPISTQRLFAAIFLVSGAALMSAR
jgi:transporter family-2 protein